jgi:hypothetical protein
MVSFLVLWLGAAPVVALAAREGTGVMVASIAFIVIYQQIESYVIGSRPLP